MAATFFCKSTCVTCRKAKAYLDDLGASYEERNYARQVLTKDEVLHLLDVVGSVAPLVRARHKTVKEKGWHEKPPAKGTFVKAVLEDNNVLMRPVVVRGKKAVVGFDEETLAKLLR